MYIIFNTTCAREIRVLNNFMENKNSYILRHKCIFLFVPHDVHYFLDRHDQFSRLIMKQQTDTTYFRIYNIRNDFSAGVVNYLLIIHYMLLIPLCHNYSLDRLLSLAFLT